MKVATTSRNKSAPEEEKKKVDKLRSNALLLAMKQKALIKQEAELKGENKTETNAATAKQQEKQATTKLKMIQREQQKVENNSGKTNRAWAAKLKAEATKAKSEIKLNKVAV